MPFDIESEGNEPLRKIELYFHSGRPRTEAELPMPPMAYIGLGSYFTSRSDNVPMLTNESASYGELQNEVDRLKAGLDALLAEAKARFTASFSN